jgi:hypothetical protein
MNSEDTQAVAQRAVSVDFAVFRENYLGRLAPFLSTQDRGGG